ncbi:MAG: inositol monophosphatase [Nitriliruptoraceae bacterium]|nr:inositol monophosphatase [Nitriliruptoraceae bacterium]
MPDAALHRRLAVASEIAAAAGSQLLDAAAALASGDALQTSSKSSATDPVSAADLASEALIAERLAAAFPDDGLLAEEGGASRPSTSGRTWVVDPLDGTVNFLYGIPHWSVSIACVDEAGASIAVVHDPNRSETFRAARGDGATLGGRHLTVTEVADPGQALVGTGFAYDAALRAVQIEQLGDLVGRVRDVRRSGSAALDLAWYAAGRLDGFFEAGLGPWDWAAGALLVREAGGEVTHHRPDLAGEPRAGLAAAGAGLHPLLATRLGASVTEPDLRVTAGP